MANVYTPETTDTINQLVAFAISYISAFCANDSGPGVLLFQAMQIGERLDQVAVGC